MKINNNLYTVIAALLISCFAVEQPMAEDYTSSSKIQGQLNIINGASAECVMHHFYTQSGWTQIEGEIGRNGIDGLYYKKKGNTIKEVLVAESKWNKSRLGRSGKDKAIKQMSQEWVLRTLDKLVNKIHTKTYSTIQQFIKHDQYRARLFRLKPVGKNGIQITIFSIKNKGFNIFEEVQNRKLEPININNPKNSFEKNIVKSYNDCRKIYLHKYIKALSNNAVEILLKDNYIKKDDVKKLLTRSNLPTTQVASYSAVGLHVRKRESKGKKVFKQIAPVTGKVWVNTKSHVYHCSGTRWYGNTKYGKYADEVIAIKTGNRPSKGAHCSSEGRKAKKSHVQTVSNTTKVWVNTKSHVYHCSGSRWYGKTKHGRFMAESEAVNVGNRGARGKKCG